MNSRLILYVDEHWPRQPALPWVLIDERGQRVQEGHSAPAHWPAAGQTEVVLGGPQSVWLEPEIPKAARREQTRLLAYALEDRIASDPDTQHLTVTHREPGANGQRIGVLLVARARLRGLIAQLQAIGRAPVRVCSELQFGGGDPQTWALTLGPAGTQLLHTGGTRVIPLDGENLPVVLAHCLMRARSANQAPARLEVLTTAEQSMPQLAETLPADLQISGPQPYAWWETCQRAENLLHDEFANRNNRNSWLHAVRRPLQLAAGVAALYVASLGGELVWQSWQLRHTEERMTRLFETTLPKVPAVAPAAQLHRELEVRRAAQGRLRDDDALALLLAYTEARGTGATASVSAMAYENGQLRLNLPKLPAAQRDALIARLEERGIRALAKPGDEGEITLTREALQ